MYYESHITIEPVVGERLTECSNIVRHFGFKPAELFMAKRLEDTPERSKFDFFCTGHSASEIDLADRQYRCVRSLLDHNFGVWRYKIEHVIMDSRNNDVYGIFKKECCNVV